MLLISGRYVNTAMSSRFGRASARKTKKSRRDRLDQRFCFRGTGPPWVSALPEAAGAAELPGVAVSWKSWISIGRPAWQGWGRM